MQPHFDPVIHALLQELLADIRRVLGEKLIGFYVYGSLVWGDFDFNISDIDTLAALDRDLTDAEGGALVAMHAAFAARYPAWDHRIEVQYMARRGLQMFRTETHRMGNISPGEPFHIIDADRAWLMNWYFVRTYGVTLHGEPPQTLIAPISKQEFIDAIREHADQWKTYIAYAKEQPSYRGYAVLTLTRALCSLELGEQVSKKQAVEWAETHLPETWLPLIRRAWVARHDPTHTDLTYEETAQFVGYARGQILGALS